MTVKIFNRTIVIPKDGKTITEKFEICGLKIDIMFSVLRLETINAISLNIVINKCIISAVRFTKETIRDSSRADLIILNSVFNTRVSADILKQMNP